MVNKNRSPFITPVDANAVPPSADSFQYISFDPRYLQTDIPLSFALFIFNKENNKFILYKQKDHPIDRDRLNRLTQDGVRTVYVHRDEAESLHQYLSGGLTNIVDDPSLPVEEKTEKFHALASTVLKGLFDSPPDMGTFISTAKNVSDSVAKLVVSEPKAILHLNRLRSYDYYTFSHSLNVTVLTVGLYQNITSDNSLETIENLTRGVLLHDIGKCDIPNEILNKCGPLNPEEWDIMKSHSARGYERLKEDQALSEDSRLVALLHHEAIDGSGYPKGYKGEDIPLTSRICKVIDVYDALSSKRPYKNRMIPYQALQIMTKEMNQKLDMAILKKFVLFLQQMGKLGVRHGSSSPL